MTESPFEASTNPIRKTFGAVRAFVDWMARSRWRSFMVIFLLSFAIRGYCLMVLVPRESVLPHTRWELEAVAFSLAESGQFADPYMIPTGPTAHLPPILPGILALIWRVFGMGLAAGYAAWLFRIACYAAMYGALPWFAGRLGLGRQPGVLAGIAGAVVAGWPGYSEAPTALVLGLLLIAFLRRWTSARSSPGGSFLLGLASGGAFHLQPALLPVVLGLMAFELWWSRDRRKWTLSVVLALGIVLACVPWGWRNYATFHEVFFIRSNFGLELRMAHHEGAAAAMEVMDARQEHRHPRLHLADARQVRDEGEVEYMRQARREALEWIRTHPRKFLCLTGSRVIHFWCGPLHRPGMAAGISLLTILAILGAWRMMPVLTTPQRAALLIPLATYPLVYYVVTYMYRYRIPLNWILLILASAEIWHCIKRR